MVLLHPSTSPWVGASFCRLGVGRVKYRYVCGFIYNVVSLRSHFEYLPKAYHA